VVLTNAPLNLEADPTHDGADGMTYAARGGPRVRYVHGVAEWLVRRTAYTHCGDEGEEARRTAGASAREESEILSSLNHLVGHPFDVVRELERQLASWDDERFSRMARVCAVLLHPVVRDQMERYRAGRDGDPVRERLGHNYWATEEAVRGALDACLEASSGDARERIAERAEAALAAPRPTARHDQLRDSAPTPTFACRVCGALRHTAKDARFHCRAHPVYRS
jgi:hypothetical protein